MSLLLEDVGLAPGSLFEAQDGTSALDRVGVRDTGLEERSGQLTALWTLVFEDELALTIPGLSAVALVFGGNGQESAFDFEADLLEPRSVRLVNASMALRFSADVLKPVRKVGGRFEVDPTRKQVEIGVTATITIDGDSIRVDGADELTLEPCMIGDSGIVIEAEGVKLDLSRESSIPEADAAGLPATWTGVFIDKAAVHAPPDLGDLLPDDLTFDHCFIGAGGFTGHVKAEWTPALSRSLAGVEFSLKRVDIGFVQSAFNRTQIEGTITLPFFDEAVDVTVGLKAGGGFTVKLTSSDGLYRLTKAGVIEVELDSVAFEMDAGVFTTKLSGKLTPLFGTNQGLKWPTFDVKDLTIDSKGNVRLPGGWLSLTEQKALDFYGFKIEIAQIGFGKTDDGGKWIGFSGALKLVDGLKAGASVEGLRITWQEGGTPKITLNGAGVELTIPGVLHLKGAVSYRELVVGNETIHRFDGDIKIELVTPEMKIDGTLVIGSAKGPQGRYNFFAIYTDVELPTGIPLASTGLAIYGFAGLFALQMEPDKHDDEMWFSIDHSKSFYHRGTPGITDLKAKWVPRKGSFALGAGITLGSLPDNKYTLNGKFLLAIVIPGPIVLLQGAAQFLKKQKGGSGDEGAFRALAVFDGRLGTVQIGLDAEYKTGKGGELIEIAGSMEAFYAFHDPTAWHLWLGKDEPRSLRIRALFGKFVEANAYFMLDAHQLALGAWYGYNNGWNFGPLSIRLEAWAEGNARLSFRPSQFHGDLWIHGLVELKAFGLGLGIALDAKIAADLFRPFHLVGQFSVGIKIPFRKKPLGATVKLEWGPRPDPPPLPLPVTQMAVEHLKSTVVWPLPRGKYLLPVRDDGDGFLTSPSGDLEPLDLDTVPLVPLDSRVSVTFGRSVHDGAMVGVNLQQVDPDVETIGDPQSGGAVATVKYVLQSLELWRRDGASWQLVAKSPSTGSPPALFGSWMPVPQLPDSNSKPPKPGQTKLLIGSKTPFDFTRATGSSWEEWVSDAWPGYPCFPALPAEERCVDFDAMKPGEVLTSPWSHPEPPAFTLSWGFGPATVHALPVPGSSASMNVLCFPEAAGRRGVRVHSHEPGRSFSIVLAPSVAPNPTPAADARRGHIFEDSSTCVDLRTRTAGTLANPWSEGGVRFTVRGADGQPLHQARVERWETSPLGLNAGFRLDIELPCASPWVELIVTHRPPFRVVAFNANGAVVNTHAPSGTGGVVTESIRLEGVGITRVEIDAAGNEKLVHSVCFDCPRPTGPSGTWYDDAGNPHGPVVAVGNTILVTGPGIVDVVLTGDSGLCIQKICVTPDPEAGQVAHRDDLIQHIQDELARWHGEGAVLAPHTTYRLTVRTLVVPTALGNFSFPAIDMNPSEHAYFRTGGPPGLTQLSLPDGVPDDGTFDSGLDDLVRYVHETDPPTVPPPGEKPILFRPFYRAYDIGVEFNEDYVEQMYRMDRRDLGLYLYDNNNQPVHDAKGRLLVLANRWGKAETLTLSDKDVRWVTLIDGAACLPDKLDPQTFPRASALASSDPNRVLAADTLHEARLVPLLLHETFADASLADPGPPSGWYVEDSGAGGPSQWQVGEVGEPPSRFVEQVSAIGDAGPARPGTLLLLADPPQPLAGDAGPASQWTDYRVSVYVRSSIGGAVGLVVRHQGAGTGYRFALDGGVRRLVKLGSGTTLLAEDHFAYRKNRDYRLTVEVLGPTLRTYVDGEPVFEITDAEYDHGRIGLYTCQSAGARFTDLMVDDLRPGAPVVYRFQLTTSLYANFFHHVHSFEDMVWPASVGADPSVPALLNEAVAPSFALPAEPESRAYEALAALALGPSARQNATRVEVTRVARDGAPPLFLLRSPEPLGPARLELKLSRSARALPDAALPGEVKLTDAALGAARPEGESVTLLQREAAALTRSRIELRQLPGPLREPTGDPVLWLESFGESRALERFTIVDTPGGTSDWAVESGGLVEISGVGGGDEPELPGTHALAGEADWSDYRLTVDVRADAGGEVGVLLRYRDEDNYYRLSAGATRRYRRLVKCVGGQTTVLWEDVQESYTAGEPFRLAVEIVGSRLIGFHDDAQIFDVRDEAHDAGRIGIYASANPGVRWERIEVRRPSLERRAWLTDRFAENNLDDWTTVSEVVSVLPTVEWETADGALRLKSLIAAGGDPAYPGAYAASLALAPPDVILQARLRSTGGAIGVVVRGTGAGDYYRFSMSQDQGYRQLVKKVGSVVTVLWRDAVAYEADRTYEVTVSAIGSMLRGYLDGVPIFAVEDAELPAGVVALYAWDNQQAWFSDVRVWSGDQAYDGWLLNESFASFVPDRWSFVDQAGAPETNRWSVEGGALLLSPAVSPAPSAHFAVAAPPEVAELRLVVRVGLDAGGVAGVVFAWRDAANHLALWLDAAGGTRRLLRVEAGVVDTLWQDAVPPDTGHEQCVTIDHSDGRLVGYLDGVELFSLDAPAVAGHVGLAVWGDGGARFREVLLAAPEWSCWHGFGEEEQLPAGTRVRVHAGLPPATPAEAGLMLRSAALPGERRRLRLPAVGATLRVVGADGRPGHARTFVPDSLYTPVAMRVLRKADSTALFLVPDAAQTSTGGSLRLQLTYHRDRLEAGRPMSQAGDRGKEQATIEFPS